MHNTPLGAVAAILVSMYFIIMGIRYITKYRAIARSVMVRKDEVSPLRYLIKKSVGETEDDGDYLEGRTLASGYSSVAVGVALLAVVLYTAVVTGFH
jgi:hypothetical protein